MPAAKHGEPPTELARLTEHVGDESSLALYRSEGPDNAGRTAANWP